MRGHFLEDIFGRQRLDKADVAFDESLAGKNRLSAGSAIATVKAVDGQGRVEHQSVEIAAVPRRIEFAESKLRF